MKKVYYLKSCSTCTRIMKDFDLSEFELQNLKTDPISQEDLEEIYKLTGSYESLFSKRSTQIKTRGIKLQDLKEDDFKALILDHYSFLKRPVFLDGDKVFVGNDKHTIDELHIHFN